MLLVIDPVSDVLRSTNSFECAETVRLVIQPLAVIAVAIIMNKTAESISLVLLPHALVFASISPDLDPSALSLPLQIPVTHVYRVIVQIARAFRYQLLADTELHQ